MIIRVRSPNGMDRVEVGLKDTLAQLLEKLTPTLNAPSPDAIILTRDASRQEILAEFEQSLLSLGLKHGDIIYADIAPSARPSEEPANTTAAAKHASERPSFVQQEPVDNMLEKSDGLIKRERDAKMCKHGANAMCDYCMPKDPFDSEYLEQQGIKHMSFQAYLRKVLAEYKIHGDISGGLPANVPPPLEDPDYCVKPNCLNGHAPWPKGICSKCQPSAITLHRQRFRMVDNVEFASRSLIETLLTFWQKTGSQRFGFLYGHYDPLYDVPLGVKAVVEAIYEPKQGWEVDGIKLAIGSEEFDQEIARADAAAEACGMKMVGMIFTDLVPTGESNKVVYRRHANSYFLTSLECRLAAYMELKHPNPCRWARGGHFGSKFVTCCVSGNQNGDIDISAWQLSNSAMAMQKADLIVPSSVPSSMCVQEPAKSRYVPDIFYSYKNEYNLQVSANAKPAFPVDYLLVNVTNGYPREPNSAFRTNSAFVLENREHVDHQVQTPGAIKRHLGSAQGNPEQLCILLSDFHLLVYLTSLDVLGQNEIALIGRIVSQPMEAEQFAEELVQSAGWQTLMLVLNEAADSDLNTSAGSSSDMAAANAAIGSAASSAPNPSSGAVNSTWACRHCTFENSGTADSCEMCGLPRNQ
ncbi:nuclear protein localization protein 4 [Coemansia guatemalensis]|uniref:Nuclear protein localization protein 4 n=1 Tax=Coemansia guatemalensis TaxID=2761395 RepID=A0A9W8HQI7_9FUNG|nr:nuclear protein localization protein 4 [Coemansia guatemalensis]